MKSDVATGRRMKMREGFTSGRVRHGVASSPRWRLLAASGATTQRLLWASTGTKDPAYKDTMYVEALIGRDTVVTVPPATMDAFRDHGEVTADVIEQDVEDARAMLAALEQHGISLDEVTEDLTKQGVRQFADAFDKLLDAIARRRRMLLDTAVHPED